MMFLVLFSNLRNLSPGRLDNIYFIKFLMNTQMREEIPGFLPYLLLPIKKRLC
jgi:hypothetical protein